MKYTVYWVLGFGKFGKKAVKKIKEDKSVKTKLVIVDSDPHLSVSIPGVEIIKCDAIRWLYHAMKQQENKADWIIPSLPVHVAGEFLKKNLLKTHSVENLRISPKIIEHIPNIYHIRKGQICTSYANWICPDNCSENDEICSKTGENRPKAIFELLSEINFEKVQVVIIKSIQLFDGIGGYKPDQLIMAKNKIHKHFGNNFAIVTACKCHGIIDFIHIN